MRSKKAWLLFVAVFIFAMTGCSLENAGTSSVRSTQGTNSTVQTKSSGTITEGGQANGVWRQITPAAAFPARMNHQAVVFKDKIWVFGGGNSTSELLRDVWYSSDGMNWVEGTRDGGYPESSGGTSFVFDDRIWFITQQDTGNGYISEIWNSADGIEWSKVNPSGDFLSRFGKDALVFDDTIWMFGGWNITFFNDVICSKDGVNWTMVSTDASFSKRADYCSVAFNDKIWLISGQGGSNTNGVWNSFDGSDWVQSTSYGKFAKRHCAQSVVFDNKIWIIGGLTDVNGQSLGNDTWYSEDGANWTELNSPAKFEGRDQFQAVVFKNKIWVIGGRTGNLMGDTEVKNDVWSLE